MAGQSSLKSPFCPVLVAASVLLLLLFTAPALAQLDCNRYCSGFPATAGEICAASCKNCTNLKGPDHYPCTSNFSLVANSSSSVGYSSSCTNVVCPAPNNTFVSGYQNCTIDCGILNLSSELLPDYNLCVTDCQSCLKNVTNNATCTTQFHLGTFITPTYNDDGWHCFRNCTKPPPTPSPPPPNSTSFLGIQAWLALLSIFCAALLLGM